MKRPFRCRCTTSAEKIIRRTCGNTASRAAKRCSIFVWAGGARVREISGRVGRDFANRRLCGLRRYRRAEAGARGMLGARAAQVRRRGESESAGCRGHRRWSRAWTHCFWSTATRASKQLSAEERLALRREHAEEWVDEIRQACLGCRAQALPKSALGKAAAYTLNMWAEAAAVFRLRGSGVVQQSGGELDAAGSAGTQELAARGQRAGRARRWRRFFRWWNPAAGWPCP